MMMMMIMEMNDLQWLVWSNTPFEHSELYKLFYLRHNMSCLVVFLYARSCSECQVWRCLQFDAAI